MDDDKIATLEEQLRQAKAVAGDYERKYEEVKTLVSFNKCMCLGYPTKCFTYLLIYNCMAL